MASAFTITRITMNTRGNGAMTSKKATDSSKIIQVDRYIVDSSRIIISMVKVSSSIMMDLNLKDISSME